ncbi:hypothetical protein KKD37_01360 [Patescibacteria group bacterium]|nr:hypothetical protein [Patescibacteria group bacterium]
MKKIIISLLTIVFVLGIVTSAAYALFSNTAKVEGITITTGSALLTVDGASGTINVNKTYSGFYPGFADYAKVTLANVSTAPITLGLTLQLTSAGGDWAALKDAFQARIIDDAGVDKTGWKTFSELNASPVYFGSLAVGSREYKAEVRIPSSFGNSIAGKSLTNVTLTLTGTQQ